MRKKTEPNRPRVARDKPNQAVLYLPFHVIAASLDTAPTPQNSTPTKGRGRGIGYGLEPTGRRPDAKTRPMQPCWTAEEENLRRRT